MARFEVGEKVTVEHPVAEAVEPARGRRMNAFGEEYRGSAAYRLCEELADVFTDDESGFDPSDPQSIFLAIPGGFQIYGDWDDEEPEQPRPFVLRRYADETGVSTAHGAKPGQDVAWGVRFPDGPCVIRWCVSEKTAVFAHLSDVKAVHGHDGKTQVVWL